MRRKAWLTLVRRDELITCTLPDNTRAQRRKEKAESWRRGASPASDWCCLSDGGLICLLNVSRTRACPSQLTSQLESDTDWWWGGWEGFFVAYLARGKCGRQWPGAKVSSAPVPVWGPSACQSHILITNIIWIYTNEYKWLPGLLKLRVINYYCR